MRHEPAHARSDEVGVASLGSMGRPQIVSGRVAGRIDVAVASKDRAERRGLRGSCEGPEIRHIHHAWRGATELAPQAVEEGRGRKQNEQEDQVAINVADLKSARRGMSVLFVQSAFPSSSMFCSALMPLFLLKQGTEQAAGVGRFDRGDLFGCTGCYDLTSSFSTFRTEVMKNSA